MAKKPINTLKEFFETGDRPTQGQFEDLIDSFVHKDSGAVVSSSNFNTVNGLLTLGFSDGTSITLTVPQGFEITEIDGLADVLALKVDKETGKGLSTNDYSALEKAKVQTATEHVSDVDPHVSAYDRENWDGKENAVEGKGLSTNDYSDEEAATVAATQEHIEDATIHTNAEEKEAFLSKLKDYQPNEVLTASAGQILRIKDNTIFKYIGSFPFTSLDLGNELNETPARWSAVLSVPAGGISVEDENGVEQFFSDAIKFEGFGFDAVNKKIVNPVTVATRNFTQGIEIGTRAGQTEAGWIGDSDKLKIKSETIDGARYFWDFVASAYTSNGWYSTFRFFVQNTANQMVSKLEVSHNLVEALTAFKASAITATGGFLSPFINAALGAKTLLLSALDNNSGQEIEIAAENSATNVNEKTLTIKNVGKFSSRTAVTRFLLQDRADGGTQETPLVEVLKMKPTNGGQSVFKGSLQSDTIVKTGGTANDVLLGNGTTKLLSEIGATSVQDKDGIEQFTGNDIRFEGFDFDAVNDKIVNPVTRADVRASQYFAFGSNAGGSTDRTKLTLEQLTASNANPMKWGIKGTPRSSSAGFISEIHQIVQYGTSDITVTEAHHDEFNVNQKLKAKEGLEVTGFLEPTNGSILQSKLVSGGGFKINQYQTSPYKITDLSSRNSANNTGWYNKIRVMLDFVDSTNTETFRYAIVELYQNSSSSEYIAEINATVKPTALDLSNLPAYADDSAAATGGLAVGRGYINSSTGALHRRLT